MTAMSIYNSTGNWKAQSYSNYVYYTPGSAGGDALISTPVSYTHLTLPTNREV